jgi:hypothetical protein
MIRLKSLLIEQDENPFLKTVQKRAVAHTSTTSSTTTEPEEEAPAPEQESTPEETVKIDTSQVKDISKIYDDVDEVVNDLDGWVSQSNVVNIYRILKKYATDRYNKQIETYISYNDKWYDAAQFFAWVYSIDETGDSLYQDIQSIGTKTFDTSFLMNQWPKFTKFIESINISGITEQDPPKPIEDTNILNALNKNTSTKPKSSKTTNQPKSQSNTVDNIWYSPKF